MLPYNWFYTEIFKILVHVSRLCEDSYCILLCLTFFNINMLTISKVDRSYIFIKMVSTFLYVLFHILKICISHRKTFFSQGLVESNLH